MKSKQKSMPVILNKTYLQFLGTTIKNGLSACLKEIQIMDNVPSPEEAKNKNCDIIITVKLNNENSSISVSEGFLSYSINAQFQVSFIFDFTDQNGQHIYSYTANGSGFNTMSGSCLDIAKPLKISMESALKQIADNIAQSTFGSAQLNDINKN